MSQPIIRLFAVAALALAIPKALGQIIVSNYSSESVGEYNLDGSLVNPSLISGLLNPSGVAVSGSNVFVTYDNSVAEFTTSGVLVNPSLISGLDTPLGIAVSGSNLFITSYFGTIGEYNLDGTAVNPSLVSGVGGVPISIAVSGSVMFVANNHSGTVGEYNLDGTVVNASLISGLGDPSGVAVTGSNLYVVYNGSVGVFTTSGAPVNASLLSGPVVPTSIAVAGSSLYVTDGMNGNVGEYNLDGTVVNASLISALAFPNAIAVATEIIGLSGNMAFGSVPVGTPASEILTISNTGNNSMTVTGITYPTGFGGDWSSGTVAAGGTQNVTVTLTPTAAQDYDGTITVASNATSGTNAISASGTGFLAPMPTPTPTPTPTPIPPRVINISTRAGVGIGGNILIPGFVINGSGVETLLIRADGPALTQFGVSGPLAQPKLEVYDNSGAVIAANTGWGTNANPSLIASAAASVGAFALPIGSADCALIVSLPAGAYTVQVSGVNATTGIALAEVYEVSSTGTQLINISTRTQVGTGANLLIPGFVISGSGNEQLLVRADGPALTQFGVGGVLAQPSLSVFDNSGNVIAANTGWGTNANPTQIDSTAATVGAFPLALGSADSAEIVNLRPGAYTMQISGVGNTTGIALAEVYVVP
jgi:hypothetical protein